MDEAFYREKQLQGWSHKFSAEDIQTISDTYHNWRADAKSCVSTGTKPYQDIKRFCASATKDRVAEQEYVLTPDRYVGLAEEEDHFNFAERFTSLKAEFEAQLKEEAELNERIKENLNRVRL